jgi:hypothetical protein
MSARSDTAAPAPATTPPAASAVVPVTAIDPDARAEMLALMDAHYQGVTAASFAADLDEKAAAILLRRGHELVGFSTLTRLDATVRGMAVTAYFSGDTIVRADAQGYSALARAWGRHVFEQADVLRRDDPARRVYWLLISAGYKTYRFLPLFFRRFLPAHDRAPDPFEREAAERLASKRFGGRFDPASGIVRLEHPTPLRPGVSELTDARLRDPHVRFFLHANPGHARGDELVCLTAVEHGNLTPAGRRMLGLPGRPVPAPPERA